MYSFLPRVLGLSLICGLSSAQPVVPAIEPLPLGQAQLGQSTGPVTVLAPGVRHYRIQRGMPDKAGIWRLMSGVLVDPGDAMQAHKCFDALHIKASLSSFQMGDGGQRYGILSGGRYATRVAAQAAAARAHDPKCKLFARHSSDDETNAAGPWEIQIVELAANSSARLSVLAAKDGASLRTRTSSLAKAAGALAAVNGGFFVMEEKDGGFPGQPSGISIVEGRLNSAPAPLRPAVLLRSRSSPAATIVRNVGLAAYLQWQDGSRTAVDGVNRRAGTVRNCGHDAQDRPIHDYTCHYGDDVVFLPAGSVWGAAHQDGQVVRFTVDAHGVVRRLQNGARADAQNAIIAITSTSPRLPEVERNVAAQQTAVFVAEGQAIESTVDGASLVNGGPTLLLAGNEVHDEALEGWAVRATNDPRHDVLMHDWVNRRNPRTALGIRDDGTVLLVVVDGHRHDISVGVTINELRKLLKALGARDAINLDGGGSTTLVVGGKVISRPSDKDGERAVGDVVAILPGQGAEQ